MGPIVQLWQAVYKPDAYKQIAISQQDYTTKDPVDQFIYLEMSGVKAIIERVHDQISNIVGVLQGSIMLTPATQAIAEDLLKDQLPGSWEKMYDGPVNPSAWIRSINKKGTALCSLVSRVQQGALFRAPINLSDLLHPETFLNAFRQRSAREQKIAIDELKLVSSFENGKLGKSSIQLEGLYL